MPPPRPPPCSCRRPCRWLDRPPEQHIPADRCATSRVLPPLAPAPAPRHVQVIKVRLMAKEHLGRYANTWDCLTKVVRQEGAQVTRGQGGPGMGQGCRWIGGAGTCPLSLQPSPHAHAYSSDSSRLPHPRRPPRRCSLALRPPCGATACGERGGAAARLPGDWWTKRQAGHAAVSPRQATEQRRTCTFHPVTEPSTHGLPPAQELPLLRHHPRARARAAAAGQRLCHGGPLARARHLCRHLCDLLQRPL